MRRLSLIVLLLALAFSVQAQTTEGEWYLDKPIKEILFKGLANVSVNEINGIVNQYRGRKFTNELFWELQGRLYALDYFESIVPNAVPGDDTRETVSIEFTVVERPQVGEIRFSGNDRVRSNDLLDVVVMKKGDIFNPAKLKLDEAAVRQLYLDRGFPNASFKTAVETDTATNKKIIVFTITEGSQTSIKAILFNGNSFASEGSLKGIMESKEQWLLSPGTYQENKLELDRKAIEKYYRERGYVDAKVQEIKKDFENDEPNNRTYVTITIFLSEGAQYQYGGMSFEGNQIFSSAKLNELMRQPAGGTINLTRVEQDFQRVADLYYENGYIFNSINREEKRDERTKTVSYTVRIVERGRAHIENIIIKGNKKTKEFVLFRELPLEVGDVFSKAKIVEGLQNLYNLQYFSAITPETPPGSVDGLMDLVVNVEEANTADIRFGAAFGGSADFPISGQVKWTDNNFLGMGQVMGAEISLSPVLQSLGFNFTEKWLLGQRWSGSLELSVRHARTSGIPMDMLTPIFNGSNPGVDAFPDPFTGEYVYASNGAPFGRQPTPAEISGNNLVTDYQYAGGTTSAVPTQYRMIYDSYDFTVGLSTGYRFRTNYGILGFGTGLGTTVTLIDYDSDLYRPYLKTDRDNRNNWQFTNSLSLSASLDKRDFYFSPSNGYYLKQLAKFVGGPLLGQRHYIKTESKGEYFFTLFSFPLIGDWRWKMVFAAHSALSMIHPQFWAPAGYNNLTAGTNDLLWVDGMYVARGWPRELDKRSLLDNWLELRMPINEQFIWLDFFFDAVGRWNTPQQMQLRKEDFLFGYGMGLRFTIPQFPIRIYLAKRFKYDELGRFQWQEGPIARDSWGLDFVFSIGYELFNQ